MHERIENKRQERIRRKIEDNKKIKEVLNARPLYMQLEEKFNSEVQNNEQERIASELRNRK